jgi:hypothetical protein
VKKLKTQQQETIRNIIVQQSMKLTRLLNLQLIIQVLIFTNEKILKIFVHIANKIEI